MGRWISKPKRMVKVQSRGASLESRLAKLEQEFAQVELDERLSDCNCDDNLVFVTAGNVAALRAEMDRLCPVHGFRELHIMHMVVVRTADDPASPAEIIEEAEVEEALNEYNRRLAESRQRREEEDD